MVYQPPPQRRDNGLRADVFVALADVDPRLGEHLLDLLRLADIAAYLEPPADPRTANRYRGQGPIERLFVQSDLRRAARDVVLDAAREAGASVPSEQPTEQPTEQVGAGVPVALPRPDPLAGVDTDAEFARIMAGFNETAPAPGGGATALGSSPFTIADGAHADRGQADVVDGDPSEVASGDGDMRSVGRAAEASRAHDAAPAQPVDETVDSVDPAFDDADEHFVPPPAPPFPVPRAGTVGAVAVLVLGLLVLARGAWFGLGGAASFPIGVILVLVAVGLFVRGLRETDSEDVDPDDGAIV